MTAVGIKGSGRLHDRYDLKAIFGAAAPRRLDRLSEMAVAASGLAFKQSGLLPLSAEASLRAGVFFATAQGNFSGTISFLEKIRDKGARFASPIDFPNLVPSAGAGALSMQFQLKGELLTLTHAAYAGLQALCFAFDALRTGRLHLALAAGAEGMSAARSRCAELLGETQLDEGAAALVLADADAAVRMAAMAMVGPGADYGLVIEKCLAGARDRKVEIVRAPERGELDVGGLIDAAYACERIAAGDLRQALCVSRGSDGACAVLLEGAA